MADRLAELDRVAREIDRARQRQAALCVASLEADSPECRKIREELDRLYKTYALLVLPREARHGR